MGGYEICPDSYEILSGFCSFHEVRKAGMLRVSQGQYTERKRPYVARKLCATQGLKFLSFLGVSQNVQVCPFDWVTGCERFPKTCNDLVRSLYYSQTALATKE
jgi:hypothetical protein